MDRYVIELGRSFSHSIKKYLGKTSGRKPYQVGDSEVVQEFFMPIMDQLADNLRRLSDSRGDWSYHVYRVRKVGGKYRPA